MGQRRKEDEPTTKPGVVRTSQPPTSQKRAVPSLKIAEPEPVTAAATTNKEKEDSHAEGEQENLIMAGE